MMSRSPQHGDLPFRLFDPHEDVLIVERKLPHWAQAGTICFITWRTWDSMPAPVLRRWLRQRWTLLEEFQIDRHCEDWKSRIARMPAVQRRELHRRLASQFDDHLDRCHGACVLKQSELSSIVAESLHHFDGQRYELTDFVIMPNHVHLLAAFPHEAAMLAQCDSWKHYTAVQLNRRLGRTSRFWQQDGFDHLVRGLEQFEALRRYIAANPRKARLRPGQYLHFQKNLHCQ